MNNWRSEMRYFIRYIKMNIAYNTLNELLECMKKISSPLITDDKLGRVEYTRDFIESWILSYEYKYRKKRFWKRMKGED